MIAPLKKQTAQILPLYELKITLRGSKPPKETLDWLGGQFDPGHFDLQKINAQLRRLGI